MPANTLAARSAEPSPAAAAAATAATGEALSFEAAMERLERIVEQMENARLPLEELIRSYEEGTGLIRVCSERLSAAEQRIEIITRDAAGQARVSEYAPPAASAAANAPAPAATPKPAPEPKVAAEAAPPIPSLSRSSKNTNEVSLF
jgi:exodeoxyribonuclease VII small subunit